MKISTIIKNFLFPTSTLNSLPINDPIEPEMPTSEPIVINLEQDAKNLPIGSKIHFYGKEENGWYEKLESGKVIIKVKNKITGEWRELEVK